MAYTVITYESAQQLSDALGLPVVPNLDDQELSDLMAPTDTVICGGNLYTLIQGVLPDNIQVLAKALYYTVVTGDIIQNFVTYGGETMTHTGIPITYNEPLTP